MLIYHFPPWLSTFLCKIINSIHFRVHNYQFCTICVPVKKALRPKPESQGLLLNYAFARYRKVTT